MILESLLDAGDGSSIAIYGTDGKAVTFAALRQRIARIRQSLHSAGVRPGHRVAVILPNGPDMATTMLGVMSTCAAAPLNPALGDLELTSLFDDLRPDGAIIHPSASAAIDVAQRRGVPLLDLSTLAGDPRCLPDENATALLLYTSGTTSKPKLVPLTQANLCESAQNIRRTLALTAEDRSFNVMPLFHVHGLVGALLGSLAAGASCVCAERFDPFRFLNQLTESAATWYSAVPTIHQAVIAADGARPRIRFVRSCSSHLAPSLWMEIERYFDAPLVNCYGMSEASHQITSGRQYGTVGRAGATELAILGEDGAVLQEGARGEVGIRGPSVISGYLGDRTINASAFVGGWLRTGDEGALDANANLTLHGRLKEIINRGGEKISPFEIDEVFLCHPAIKQAIAFPLPHPRLGEQVGLAVVLRPGSTVETRELLRFAGERLSRFKLPRQIVFLDEIPKGPTGKPQRNSLAGRLAARSAS